MTGSKIDPHFYAAFLAAHSACHVLDLLPNSDLVEDLKYLILTQHNLFTHMLEGKHFGSDALTKFLNQTLAIKEEAIRIREGTD